MDARWLTPILNVTDFRASVAWFEKLGWKKQWDWGSPPDFGCVASGGCQIFLCLDGQGGRSPVEPPTSRRPLDETAEHGVWWLRPGATLPWDA